MTPSRISIVIPAHNEEAVISRCLSALLDGTTPKELEIIVVCNGCSDNTAEVVRRFQAKFFSHALITVLETDVANKSVALNMGDNHASGYPRFYIDADISIPIDAIRATAFALRTGTILAAAPSLNVAIENRPRAIKAFYRIWMQLPYVNNKMLGCGVYATSEEGRKRFDKFPALIADDCFFRMQYSSEEKKSLSDHFFTIFPPLTLKELIAINARRIAGHEEIRSLYSLTEAERITQRRALLDLAANPLLWFDITIYVLIKAASVLLYKTKKKAYFKNNWHRDLSSRNANLGTNETSKRGIAPP